MSLENASTTLRRGIAVLDALSSGTAIRRGGLPAGEIATMIGADKSQVSRTLSVLVEVGYVTKEADSRLFRIGWRLYTNAVRAMDSLLLMEAQLLVGKLVADFGEQTHVVVLQGTHSMTVLAEKPNRALSSNAWVGRLTPAHATASGRALLLDHSLDELVALFGTHPLPRTTFNAPASVTELHERIVAARVHGYVVVEAELEEGLLAAAAPVRGPGGSIRAAIGLAGPEFRLQPRLEQVSEAVLSAANQLTRALNGAAPQNES